jgi:Outer membrane receptor proteins, mostly Fe transport
MAFNLSTICGQNKVVYGNVKDATSGESIIGAQVYSADYSMGTFTNPYGFYSLSNTNDSLHLVCSMIGYNKFEVSFKMNSDTTINISLYPQDRTLNEAVVYATRGQSVGQYNLTSEQIKQIPTIGGEPDVMKAIQMLPGVMSGNDGANNLSVRGGSHWQNLVILDEAVVYNPNHALSLFSVFNSDAINHASVYKSYIPLSYGGRLSSVMDIRMKEGNNKKLGVKGGVGFIASRLTVESPIVKDKVSFIISGRYGSPGKIIDLMNNNGVYSFGPKIDELSGTKVDFYDINAKINAQVNDRNKLYISFYNSKDLFKSAALIDDYSMNWGNTTGTFRWNSIVSDKINMTNTLCYSDYFYKYEHFADGRNYKWDSEMRLFSFKNNWDYFLSNRFTLQAGINVDYFTTNPGRIDKVNENSTIEPYKMETRKSSDIAVYAELKYKINDYWNVNGGLRYNTNHSYRNDFLSKKTYYNPEPRFELTYSPDRINIFSMSANMTSQNMHLLSNSSVGIPSDIWVPANAKLKPSTSYQTSLGYKRNMFDKGYTFSAEGYYRNTRNIVDYKDNADIFLNNEIEGQLETGWADSYGLELYLSKDIGKLTGWVSYTISQSKNHIDAVNNGKGYAPVYDRPHDLKTALSYQIHPRWNVSSVFALRSGMNVTLPISSYVYQGAVFYEYSERNGYRAPMYHQLDLSISYKPKSTKRWQSEWVFGVMNLYNRKNIFSMYAGRDNENINKTNATKMYLYGALPSVSYNFKF